MLIELRSCKFNNALRKYLKILYVNFFYSSLKPFVQHDADTTIPPHLTKDPMSTVSNDNL